MSRADQRISYAHIFRPHSDPKHERHSSIPEIHEIVEGSFPSTDVSASPVYNLVHQGRIAAEQENLSVCKCSITPQK